MDIVTTAKGQKFEVENLVVDGQTMSFSAKDKDLNRAASTFEDLEETSALVINEVVELNNYAFVSFGFSDGKLNVLLRRRNDNG